LDPAAKFWSKVKKSDDPDGCWVWTGARTVAGYGSFQLNGRMMRTHRAVMLLSGTELAAGSVVLHRCDNPPCCRPDHLFVGTHRDNARDMAVKQRGRGGRRPAKVPQDKTVHFRLTRGEERALAELVDIHAQKLAEMGVNSGSANAWFTAIMRRECAKAGIEIVEPTGAPRTPAAPG
jgi:hypothetical protein